MRSPIPHSKSLAALSARHRAAHSSSHAPHGSFATLTIGALGIVYGDIGTSPLYAMDQLFLGRAGGAQTPADVLGGVSLVIWTITLIVALKYAIFVLRAQNDGEGGVFALYGLLADHKKRSTTFLLWSLMLGAGLLFGDGMITPAISVLSAVEGLQVATPALGHTVIPITIGLLTVLFAVQFKGTSGIGMVFGPLLLIWFVVIAFLGAWQIEQHPEVLAAFNPIYGLDFLRHAGRFDALLILGALMLVVTGSEAMYADVGHFGARPIRASWFAVVYPALLLNYLGQGAFLLTGAPIAGGKLFFSLVPPSMLYPMVLLAIVATIIASQALISGVFSLVSQAIRLGLFPRLDLLHTHQAYPGQIYVPFINRALFAGCILLVLTFGSSSALTAPLGLAVSGLTVITSLAMFPVARRYWNWGTASTGLLWGAPDRRQHFVPCREFVQIPRRRVRTTFGRHRCVSGDDDVALGPQGDLRGLFRQVHNDDCGAGGAPSQVRGFHGAKRRGDGGKLGASADRSRSCDCPDVVGAARHPAAQSDPSSSNASKGPLHPG